MRKFAILLSSFLVVGFLMAQSNQFLVYSVKGNVMISQGSTDTKAKTGAMLGGAEKIKLPAGAAITIICNQKRIFTLNKQGSHSLSADSCTTSPHRSVSENYLRYIWSELTRSKGTPEKNRKAFMSNVGAVSRSINNVWIDPRLDTFYYVVGNFPLSWKSYVETDSFDFKLFADADGNSELFSRTTSKKHVDIAEIGNIMKTGKTYYWTAMVKGENNDELKLIKIWDAMGFGMYQEMLEIMMVYESEAEKHFRLGFILEEDHFLAEAYNHYLKATQLAPENTLYRSVFMSFKKDYEIK